MSAFYERSGDGFVALPSSVGPWDPRMQNGVCIAGLMAQVLTEQPSAEAMDIARLHIDILRPTPVGPLRIDCTPVRNGKRMQLLELTLTVDGAPMVRAFGLRLRMAESPAIAVPPPATQPEAYPSRPTEGRGGMAELLDIRTVTGGGWDDPGPGSAWIRFNGEVIAGQPVTPFVTAAMVCDFGSGLSTALPRPAYSFANVDISMNLARAPRDSWILIEAETHTHGQGRALANSVLSDRHGEFARAHQSLFIDRQSGE